MASGRRWQAILPGCRSVIVCGSGGRQLWDAFLNDAKCNPQYFVNQAHPLDAFVQRTLARFDPKPPASRVWIRCAASENRFVDFRPLSVEAGLGWESRLGLLMNPTFGPWMALRLACFSTEYIDPTSPLPGLGPCDSCDDTPCVRKCPAHAVSISSRWDVQRCATFHDVSTQCAYTCHSREACPVGKKYIYPDIERLYHYNRKIGRQVLAKHLKLDVDELGTGPHWKDWA